MELRTDQCQCRIEVCTRLRVIGTRFRGVCGGEGPAKFADFDLAGAAVQAVQLGFDLFIVQQGEEQVLRLQLIITQGSGFCLGTEDEFGQFIRRHRRLRYCT